MAVAGAALVVSSSVFATGMNSIADSWHNLGAGNSKGVTPNGGSPANHSNETGEICVFCHTPHGGDTGAAVPLWNRHLSDPSIYTRYSQAGGTGTTTFDAQEAPVGSVSIACLSCHDGTQALDSLINAPGSGNNWPATTTMMGADVTSQGMLATNIIQNLGTDLSNDHPISMQYAGGGIDAGTGLDTTNDPDFTHGSGRNISLPDGVSTYPVQLKSGTTTNGLQVWWIERFAKSENDGARDRSDVILYTRNDLGTPQPFVECGSCHDPHNVDNPTFLRVSNGRVINTTTGEVDPALAASGLCLTCHDK